MASEDEWAQVGGLSVEDLDLPLGPLLDPIIPPLPQRTTRLQTGSLRPHQLIASLSHLPARAHAATLQHSTLPGEDDFRHSCICKEPTDTGYAWVLISL